MTRVSQRDLDLRVEAEQPSSVHVAVEPDRRTEAPKYHRMGVSRQLIFPVARNELFCITKLLISIHRYTISVRPPRARPVFTSRDVIKAYHDRSLSGASCDSRLEVFRIATKKYLY
ncbi:hypothetical protein EVAR_65779_1 [Eumeta japonica]|uniref:Uncharacterized protein n=1 Tax=Eumeta variegata TaxID=151549 RepID=A0A4C2A4A9_EUMVA|nr:hypothetical protein EVAR_65779_1 [Eumeta japonica]